MALSDFWELKDNQVKAGKPALNVYHLQRILAGANANMVGQAFIKSILNDHLQALQSIAVLRTTIEVRNLGDVTDFISIDSSTLPGLRAGTQMANFNAATIQLNRTRTDMKNGQKRFAVGVETDISGNNWDSPFIALLAALGVALLGPWETVAAPGIDVCDLVILKRICVVEGQDPCLKYRLPDSTEIDTSFYNPSTAIVRSKARSQVSRKVLN